MKSVAEVNNGFKETEIGLIPEDWEVSFIDKIGSVKGGKRLPKGHSFSVSITPYPYLRVVDFENGSINKNDLKYLTPEDYQHIKNYTISKEDVFISIAGTIGMIGIIPEELDGANLTENAAKIVIYDKTALYSHFLKYFLSSLIGQKEIEVRTTKTSQPKLALTRIKQIPLPLPPLPEQKKIASVLSTIQEAKEKTENVIKATKELKKSMMKHLFTYGAVSMEDAEKVPLKETEIGMIPEKWEVVKLGLLSRIRTSFPSFTQIPKMDNKNKKDKLVLALKVSDMNIAGNEKYIIKSNIFFNCDNNKIEKCLKPYSVVFPKRGGAIGTNKKRITKHFAILDPNLIGVEPKERLDGSYLFAFFDNFDLKSLQDNTPIPQLNKHNVENILFPLPPLPEQQQISQILSSIDAKIEAEENKKQALEALFKTLLSNLMTGNVLVQRELDFQPG